MFRFYFSAAQAASQAAHSEKAKYIVLSDGQKFQFTERVEGGRKLISRYDDMQLVYMGEREPVVCVEGDSLGFIPESVFEEDAFAMDLEDESCTELCAEVPVHLLGAQVGGAIVNADNGIEDKRGDNKIELVPAQEKKEEPVMKLSISISVMKEIMTLYESLLRNNAFPNDVEPEIVQWSHPKHEYMYYGLDFPSLGIRVELRGDGVFYVCKGGAKEVLFDTHQKGCFKSAAEYIRGEKIVDLILIVSEDEYEGSYTDNDLVKVENIEELYKNRETDIKSIAIKFLMTKYANDPNKYYDELTRKFKEIDSVYDKIRAKLKSLLG